MKIAGKDLSQPYVETIIIPRGDEPIVLKAKAVLDYSTFEKMMPFPVAPVRMMAGGEKHVNVEDPTFKAALERRGLLRHYWMCIHSLLATPGLEYEEVKLGEPETWDKFEDELSKAGFTPFEVGRITRGIMTANGLNDAKIKAAEKDFLSRQPAPPQVQSLRPSLAAEVRSIQSGEPVSASV